MSEQPQTLDQPKSLMQSDNASVRVAIVGAGMAGLACAETLIVGGAKVTLFDKGRGPGGRMSSRSLDTESGEAVFDHGAQYLTARDPDFAAVVEAWRARGLVAPWPAAGPDAFVGTPAMNAPLKVMAASLDVRWNVRVESLTRTADGWRCLGEGIAVDPLFSAVVVAIPAEQAGALLAPFDAGMAEAAAAARAAPCWTVMAAFAAPLAIEADTLKETGPIGWAARNSAKPGRMGPESWVIQAGPDWSIAHLEDDAEQVTADLLAALTQAAGCALPRVLAATAHRWRFARYGEGRGAPIWRGDIGLGLCGDWLLGPRVEYAWVSGHRLARTMLNTDIVSP